MKIEANDPKHTSWLEVAPNSDFPIQNIPFGIFKTANKSARVGSRIGDQVIDLLEMQRAGYFDAMNADEKIFNSCSLNRLLKEGKEFTRRLRNRLAELFNEENQELQKNVEHIQKILLP